MSQRDKIEELEEENSRLRELVETLAGLVDNEAFILMRAARESLQILRRGGRR